MKFLLTFLISSLLTTNSPVWFTDFNKAKTEATASGRYILINFSGSDWCGPCIRLHKEIFEADAFTDYAQKKLVLVNADFPRLRKNQLSKDQQKVNDALAEQFDPQGHFPYTVLTNANGKVLKAWDGFPNESPEKFLSDINAFVNAAH
jgi:thioredoxin-related protein